MGADYHQAPIKYMFQHQLNAVLDQVAPVQNTWYPVLVANEDVRLIAVSLAIITTGETIAFRITVDGITYEGTFPAAAGTLYHVYRQNPYVGFNMGLGIADFTIYNPFLLEGQSIAVDARKTTANGVGNLCASVGWARLLPT